MIKNQKKEKIESNKEKIKRLSKKFNYKDYINLLTRGY